MAIAGATLPLRLTGAIAASAAFGLIATMVWPGASLLPAVGLGFLFGTSFIGGTGYRIILAAMRGTRTPAPASWSGATAGSALLALLLWSGLRIAEIDGTPVLLGFGIGINIAYLLAKTACISADCCHAVADRRLAVDLRWVEIAGTLLTLAGAGLAAMASMRLAAVMAIAGHLVIRLLSRWARRRWAWGWPPLRQPGAEIAPLLIALAVSLAPV